MSASPPPPRDPRSAAAHDDEIERHAAEFLDRVESGEELTADEFLQELTQDLRTRCRDSIEHLDRVRSALGDLGELPTEPRDEPTSADSPLPTVPGFRIESRLGRGGLGSVYSAWDETLERRVAIKILRAGTPRSQREHVLREARQAARIRHPGIVTIYSIVDQEPRPAIVMELVEGFPLDRSAKALDYRSKARLLQGVAQSLAHAHDQHIVHRDLKPENILVTPEQETKILDFGLAFTLSDSSSAVGPGAFVGTPLYASPEQVRGEAITPASDVFSFGSVMFKVLTGRAPFDAESVEDVLENVSSSDPPFLRSFIEEIPEDLQAVCLACLAQDPDDRPTAETLVTELGRFIIGQPVSLRPALYGDILRQRIAAHGSDLREWVQQGMISHAEEDRLQLVYRRVLAEEDPWILDARRISFAQTLIYSGAWVVVVAAGLLVWLAREDLAPWLRWTAPLAASAALLVAGVFAYRKRDSMVAAAFLAGAILSTVPTVLSILGESTWLGSRPAGVGQLLPEPFSNQQLLVSTAIALLLSVLTLWRLRMTGFAWTSAALAVAVYGSTLLLFDLLDQPADTQAMWWLPFVAVETVALLLERRERIRWALPFHLLALATLVFSLDVIAWKGPTLTRLGLAPVPEGTPGYWTASRLDSYSLALNGVVFILLMTILERSRSLDLRRASHLLELLGPLHVIGALYANAREQSSSPDVHIDVSVYLSCSVLFLFLGPWRARRRFLITGLAGVALGSHLLIDLGLVPRAPFLLGLGASGLVIAGVTYGYLRWRPRHLSGS